MVKLAVPKFKLPELVTEPPMVILPAPWVTVVELTQLPVTVMAGSLVSRSTMPLPVVRVPATLTVPP